MLAGCGACVSLPTAQRLSLDRPAMHRPKSHNSQARPMRGSERTRGDHSCTTFLLWSQSGRERPCCSLRRMQRHPLKTGVVASDLVTFRRVPLRSSLRKCLSDFAAWVATCRGYLKHPPKWRIASPHNGNSVMNNKRFRLFLFGLAQGKSGVQGGPSVIYSCP